MIFICGTVTEQLLCFFHLCQDIYTLCCPDLLASCFLAAPRQRIELTFDEHYYIEPSFECRFDHLEVRDGPFGFSPLIDRYCGVKSPPLIRSTGRFMWIKFSSDEELEGLGFRAKYSFIPGNEFVFFFSGFTLVLESYVWKRENLVKLIKSRF